MTSMHIQHPLCIDITHVYVFPYNHTLTNMYSIGVHWTPLVVQTVESARNVGDLGSICGREDPLEKVMATLSSILAWSIPWTKEPGGLQSTGLQRVRCDLATNTYVSTYTA